MVRTATIRRGSSCPLGATLSPEGVNFSVFSKSATLVTGCEFSGQPRLLTVAVG